MFSLWLGSEVTRNIDQNPGWAWANNDVMVGGLKQQQAHMDQFKARSEFWEAWVVTEASEFARTARKDHKAAVESELTADKVAKLNCCVIMGNFVLNFWKSTEKLRY